MKALLLALKYFPVVLQGVVTVEAALTGAPGATKKAVVMSAIAAGAKVGETAPNEDVQAVSALIDSVVATLNQTGWFTPAVKQPAIAAAP
jgi:hypothetical protein